MRAFGLSIILRVEARPSSLVRDGKAPGAIGVGFGGGG